MNRRRHPLALAASAGWLALGAGWLALGSACGARSDLSMGEGSGPGSGGGASSSGPAGSTGSGGFSVDCPVDAFAGDQSGGLHIALDATHAYWTTVDGRVERGSLATGEVETLATLASSTAALALTETHVVVADTEQLMRIPKAGGVAEPLAFGQWKPVDLVAFGQKIFLLNYGNGLFDGTIESISPIDGVVTILGGLDFPRAIAVDATHVYVVAKNILDGQGLLPGPLLRVSKDGTIVSVLASELRDPFGVEVDNDRVYWGTGLNAESNLDGRLFSMPKAGGAPSLVAALGSEALPLAFAIDDAFAYITLPIFNSAPQVTMSRLLRAPLSGGEASVLVEEASRFFTLPAVSPTHIVFTVQRPVEGVRGEFANVEVFCKP